VPTVTLPFTAGEPDVEAMARRLESVA
jgi:hypothetical protein